MVVSNTSCVNKILKFKTLLNYCPSSCSTLTNYVLIVDRAVGYNTNPNLLTNSQLGNCVTRSKTSAELSALGRLFQVRWGSGMVHFPENIKMWNPGMFQEFCFIATRWGFNMI